MTDSWLAFFVFGLACVLWWRMDRLGRQLEAETASIRAELAPNDDRKREILAEWIESQKGAAKERLYFWLACALVGTAAIAGWHLLSRT